MNASIARKLFSYFPETGELRWKVDRLPVKAGDLAGWVDTAGYRCIEVAGKGYKVHRVIWLIVYGRWPKKDSDHINGIRSDNRLSNLREATEAQNCQNARRRKDNSSGQKGVSWYPRYGKWRARIAVSKQDKLLGYFEKRSDAVQAYKKAALQHHGAFARFA